MKNIDYYNVLDNKISSLENEFSELLNIQKINTKDRRKSFMFPILFLRSCGLSDEQIFDSITEGSHDNSADLIFKHKNFDGNYEFYVLQSKWNRENSCDSNMSIGEFNEIVTEFEEIKDGRVDIESNKNKKFKEKYKELQLHIKENRKVNYIILTLKNVELGSKNFKRVEKFNSNKAYNELLIYDINKLKIDYIDKEYKGYKVRNPLMYPKKPLENIEIKILPINKDGENRLLYLPAPYKSYMFCVTPHEIHKLFKRYEYSIFQDNIRNPLKTSEVNGKIPKTLKENPESFWYFNNGVTTITKQIYPLNSNREDANFKVRGLQVINGGQTFKQIFDYYDKLSDIEKALLDNNVKILFKVIESSSDEFDLDVTRYTNSQNKTEPRDFYSNDPIQKDLQSKFFRFTNIWYEIRRGEFIKRVPDGEHNISNEYFGQCYMAYYLQTPERAKSQLSTLFNRKKDKGVYEDVFNNDTKFEDLFIAGSIFDFISFREREYRRSYNSINKKIKSNNDYIMTNDEIITMDKDFLLHSSFHILMSFKKYFEKEGHKFSMVLSENYWYNNEYIKIQSIYDEIVEKIQKHIVKMKKNPGFTLTKYFKSSDSTKDIKEIID